MFLRFLSPKDFTFLCAVRKCFQAHCTIARLCKQPEYQVDVTNFARRRYFSIVDVVGVVTDYNTPTKNILYNIKNSLQ